MRNFLIDCCLTSSEQDFSTLLGPIEIQKCSYNSFIFIQTAKATGWYIVMIFFSSIMKDEASNLDNIKDLVSIQSNELVSIQSHFEKDYN